MRSHTGAMTSQIEIESVGCRSGEFFSRLFFRTCGVVVLASLSHMHRSAVFKTSHPFCFSSSAAKCSAAILVVGRSIVRSFVRCISGGERKRKVTRNSILAAVTKCPMTLPHVRGPPSFRLHARVRNMWPLHLRQRSAHCDVSAVRLL